MNFDKPEPEPEETKTDEEETQGSRRKRDPELRVIEACMAQLDALDDAVAQDRAVWYLVRRYDRNGNSDGI